MQAATPFHLHIVEDALGPLIHDEVTICVVKVTNLCDGQVKYLLSLARQGWMTTDAQTGALANRLMDKMEAAGAIDPLTRTADLHKGRG